VYLCEDAGRRDVNPRPLPDGPPASAPSQLHPGESLEPERARLARQPALGLAGLTLVVPVTLLLGVGWGGPERSLLVLGPISTFALPVIAVIAFWWEDWPGTMWRPPITGLVDTLLVTIGGLVLTIAGQAVVSHVDLQGVFDPTLDSHHAPTFPATMPLAGAVFIAILELTLVSECWPLRRLNRLVGGVTALVAAWAVALILYEALVAHHGPVSGGKFGAVLVCIAAVQVAFYVVLRGWPFVAISSRPLRLGSANAIVIAGGWLAYLVLSQPANLDPVTINAMTGSVIAAGLIVGMLFEGWAEALLPIARARMANVAAVVILAAALYVGLKVYAQVVGWTRAEPEEWIAYAGLNAIGAGVLLHVAIGRRWPFAGPDQTGVET
jgi:hypothetical protein